MTASENIKGLAKALDELATYGRVSDESRELIDNLTEKAEPPEPEDEEEKAPETSGKPPARKSTSTGGAK